MTRDRRPPVCHPDRDAFIQTYETGTAQVRWTTLVADLETPISAYLKIAGDRPNTFLLESVEGGAVRGRYSFIGRDPDLIWRCHGDRAEIARDPAAGAATYAADRAHGALDSLRALIDESRLPLPDDLPPMAAGLFGYMGYETVRLMERLPDPKEDDVGLPDGLFVRPTVIAIFDTITDRITVVTPVRPTPALSAEQALEAADDRLAQVVADLEKPLPLGLAGAAEPDAQPQPTSNMTPDAYKDMVARAKEYILAGDVFQVVLSQRFSTPFDPPPVALYRALRRLNPSPFLFFLNFDGFSVIGSSPEILVRVRDGEVTIRPIAGTRPRGETPTQDNALEEDLLADPKELAEHLMLLDLGRNDVGRVADIGSVRVTDRFIVERYSHVMHIVSNVVGTLRPDLDAIAALAAGFPAGTVSGAPKVRAMEIIDELEPTRRGLYAGCVGYISADGDLDTCIVLRTAVVKDGVMYVQAGAGIVADSDPDSEHRECLAKSQALFRAAEEAVRFAQGRN